MKMLGHPNIVSLLQGIESGHTIYIVMEVSRGGEEVLKWVQEAGSLKEDEARSIFVQVAQCHKLLSW